GPSPRAPLLAPLAEGWSTRPPPRHCSSPLSWESIARAGSTLPANAKQPAPYPDPSQPLGGGLRAMSCDTSTELQNGFALANHSVALPGGRLGTRCTPCVDGESVPSSKVPNRARAALPIAAASPIPRTTARTRLRGARFDLGEKETSAEDASVASSARRTSAAL